LILGGVSLGFTSTNLGGGGRNDNMQAVQNDTTH